MKIIKEIEKSRLKDDSLKIIQGGIGENCSQQNTYTTCGNSGIHSYEIIPCISKISCPNQYVSCTGSEASNKITCPSGYWEYPSGPGYD